MIDPTLGHAIAIAGALCLTVVTDVLGRTARAAEVAEAQLLERSAHFESLIARAADIIGVISTDGSVVSVSPAARDMLGYPPEEVAGVPIARFLPPDQVDGLDDLLRTVVDRRGDVLRVEIRLLHRDGSERAAVASLTSPSDDWGDQVVVNLHDVTTQRELEERLRHDARHDPLTGLLNRHAFSEAADRICARAERHGWTVGMLYVDLDGFKEVNDAFGHETGDRVLVETAERLTTTVRGDEIVARLGGDEFAVLLASPDNHVAAIDVAERIQDVISRPIAGLPEDVRVGASIGIAIRSHDGIEMSALMRNADEAMYRAKRNGKARWELSADTGDPLDGASLIP
jgi:diguanylate cyclase (GGDEF)-like protein/PAS domain S-box-containing protein